jgi:hypothetical protein
MERLRNAEIIHDIAVMKIYKLEQCKLRSLIIKIT